MKNDLGRDYDEQEQQALHMLTMFLKNRDSEHRINYSSGLRPRDYMYLYTKAAAAVYEMSKALSVGSAQSKAISKTPAEWIRIITGYNIGVQVSTTNTKHLEGTNGGDD